MIIEFLKVGKMNNDKNIYASYSGYTPSIQSTTAEKSKYSDVYNIGTSSIKTSLIDLIKNRTTPLYSDYNYINRV